MFHLFGLLNGRGREGCRGIWGQDNISCLGLPLDGAVSVLRFPPFLPISSISCHFVRFRALPCLALSCNVISFQTLLKRGDSLRVSIEDIASLVELSPRQVEKLRKIHNDLKPKEVPSISILPLQSTVKSSAVPCTGVSEDLLLNALLSVYAMLLQLGR